MSSFRNLINKQIKMPVIILTVTFSQSKLLSDLDAVGNVKQNMLAAVDLFIYQIPETGKPGI